MRLSDHVVRRAGPRDIALDRVAAVVLDHHAQRRRNPGLAQWRVDARGLVVLYDWPDGDDDTTAFVRTAWRR